MSTSPTRWLRDALWRWHMRRKTIHALSALSDRRLKDIGIERGEIPRVADKCLPSQAAPLRAPGNRSKRHCFQ